MILLFWCSEIQRNVALWLWIMGQAQRSNWPIMTAYYILYLEPGIFLKGSLSFLVGGRHSPSASPGIIIINQSIGNPCSNFKYLFQYNFQFLMHTTLSCPPALLLTFWIRLSALHLRRWHLMAGRQQKEIITFTVKTASITRSLLISEESKRGFGLIEWHGSSGNRKGRLLMPKKKRVHTCWCWGGGTTEWETRCHVQSQIMSEAMIGRRVDILTTDIFETLLAKFKLKFCPWMWHFDTAKLFCERWWILQRGHSWINTRDVNYRLIN